MITINQCPICSGLVPSHRQPQKQGKWELICSNDLLECHQTVEKKLIFRFWNKADEIYDHEEIVRIGKLRAFQ